jgi:hypothetical protein
LMIIFSLSWTPSLFSRTLKAVLIMMERIPIAAVLQEEQAVLLVLEGQLDRIVQLHYVWMRQLLQHFSS